MNLRGLISYGGRVLRKNYDPGGGVICQKNNEGRSSQKVVIYASSYARTEEFKRNKPRGGPVKSHSLNSIYLGSPSLRILDSNTN